MKKFIIPLAVLLALTACQKDEEDLTEHPRYIYTLDNVFSTADQVDQALTSCYTAIRTLYLSGDDWMGWAFTGSSGTDMYDVPYDRNMFAFNDYTIVNPTHTVFSTIFRRLYELAAAANMVLYSAELPQIQWGSDSKKVYCLAQARFFRAWAFRLLGELYGGVPIVDKVHTAATFDFHRDSREAVYLFAIKDLEDALEGLPAAPEDVGRVSRGAAFHCLAELYLALGTEYITLGRAEDGQVAFEKSVYYADQVIDHSVHHLMTERFGKRSKEGPVYYYAKNKAAQTPDHTYASAGVDMPGNVFWDMFQDDNINYQDGNFENLYVIQIDYIAHKTNDRDGSNYRGSVMRDPREFGPRLHVAASSYIDGDMEDRGGRCVTFVMPTMYTRDLIWQGEWAYDMRNSETCYRRTFLGNIPGTKYYGKPIPWSVLYREGGNLDAVQAGECDAFPISCKITTDRFVGLEDGQRREYLFRDKAVIRLAETILVRAEAKLRGGNASGAAADINLIRDRAQCRHRVSPAEVDIDLILDERARELMYEEIRWATLMRLGGTTAKERIMKYAYWDLPRKTITRDFNLWPIPQSFIDANKDAVIEQNPGW